MRVRCRCFRLGLLFRCCALLVGCGLRLLGFGLSCWLCRGLGLSFLPDFAHYFRLLCCFLLGLGLGCCCLSHSFARYFFLLRFIRSFLLRFVRSFRLKLVRSFRFRLVRSFWCILGPSCWRNLCGGFSGFVVRPVWSGRLGGPGHLHGRGGWVGPPVPHRPWGRCRRGGGSHLRMRR